MKTDPLTGSRPERILLVITHQGGDCRGKAIRFSDQSEFQFRSLRELGNWLTTVPAPEGLGGRVGIRPDLGDRDETP